MQNNMDLEQMSYQKKKKPGIQDKKIILIRKLRCKDSSEHQGENQSLLLVQRLSLCTKFIPRFCLHADSNICSIWQLLVPALWASNLCRTRGSHGRCHLSE